MNRKWGKLSETGGVRTCSLAVRVHCATNYASRACEELRLSDLELVNWGFTVGCLM